MEQLHELIELSGVQINSFNNPSYHSEYIKYVSECGIILLKETRLSPAASKVFSVFGVNPDDTESNQSAEFNSRLCYLTKSNPEKENDLVQRMIHQHGHLSVFGDWAVSLLIVGISDECLKELLAHHEIHVSRLTSSNCKSQGDYANIVFRVFGTEKEQHIQLENITFTMNQLHNTYGTASLSGLTMEQRNSLVPSSKISACVATASLKDWHKFIIGRYGVAGNEYQIRDLAHKLVTLFNAQYPNGIFFSHAEYDRISNKAKLTI